MFARQKFRLQCVYLQELLALYPLRFCGANMSRGIHISTPASSFGLPFLCLAVSASTTSVSLVDGIITIIIVLIKVIFVIIFFPDRRGAVLMLLLLPCHFILILLQLFVSTTNSRGYWCKCESLMLFCDGSFVQNVWDCKPARARPLRDWIACFLRLGKFSRDHTCAHDRTRYGTIPYHTIVHPQ